MNLVMIKKKGGVRGHTVQPFEEEGFY